MKPVDEWKTVLKHAWSIRFAVISAVLSGFDLALPYLMPDHPTRALAVLAAFAATASAGARLIVQFKMRADAKSDQQPPQS